MNCSTGSCLNVKRRNKNVVLSMPAQGDGSENLLLVGMKNLSLSHIPRNIFVFWKLAGAWMKELPKRSAMETGQRHFSSPKARTLQHRLFPQCGHMVPNCVLMENIFASVEGCLPTSCSFLSSALFLKESRTSPSYPPPPDFYKYKRTAAHAKGQTSSALVDRKGLDATRVGVFLCITPHIKQIRHYSE